MTEPSVPDTSVEKHNKIWRGLHRAISMPVFREPEQAILQVAQELSFTAAVLDGSPRAYAFVIHPGKLAAARGFARETISRALARMLRCRVLIGDKKALRLNKRYREWQGEYALSDAQLAECSAADAQPVTSCGTPIRDQKPRQPRQPANLNVTHQSHPAVQCDSPVTSDVIRQSHSRPECDSPVTKSVTHQSRKSFARDSGVTPDVTRQSPKCDSPVTSHIERARKRERELRESSYIPSLVVDQERNGAATPAAPPAPAPAPTRPTTPDELYAWVDVVYPERYLEQSARGWIAAGYTISDILDAIQLGLTRDRGNNLAAYVYRTLAGWHVEGGPPHRRNAGSAPAKPTIHDRREAESAARKAALAALFPSTEAGHEG